MIKKIYLLFFILAIKSFCGNPAAPFSMPRPGRLLETSTVSVGSSLMKF